MSSQQPESHLTVESSPAQAAECRNCGAPAPGKFCPECGQRTAVEPRTAAQWFDELRGQYAGRDGRLWQTLSRLLFAPGALTVEYLEGRRVRYLLPLQLYLSASVIVFAAVHVFGLDVGLRFYGQHGIHVLRASPLVIAERIEGGARLTPVQIVIDNVDTSAIRRFKAMPREERFRVLQGKREQYVSSFMLLLVPVFALLMAVGYRDRRQRYGTHMVFALHTHAFLVFMLLVEATLPAVIANIASWWVAVYFLAALHRVYGGAWAQAVVRGVTVLGLYAAIAFVANVFLVFLLLEV